MPGLLFFAALLWLTLQTLGPAPEHLAHPAWMLAPEGAIPHMSADPISTRQLIMRLCAYMMLFWIFLRAGTNADRAKSYMRAFAFFASAVALYAIIAVILRDNPLLGLPDSLDNLRGSFANRNSYAFFAVLGLLANLSAAVEKIRHHARNHALVEARSWAGMLTHSGALIYLLGALVLLLTIFLTGSRNGMGVALVSMTVLIWARTRLPDSNLPHFFTRITLPLFLAGLALSIALLVKPSGFGRFGAVAEDVRFPVYRALIEAIADRPWLGQGGGSFQHTFRAYLPAQANVAEWVQAHNSYLENIFEFGLPAALLFFAALLMIGLRLLRGVLTRKRNQSLPAFAFACFVAAALHAMFDFGMQVPAIAALFAVITGMGWAQSWSREELGKTSSRARSSDI